MLERVYHRVAQARCIDRVAVATDDERVYRAARAFGAEVYMTDPAHASGTDRVAEVAALFPSAKLVVNVQGDEPFVQPEAIEQAVAPLLREPVPVGTLKTALRDEDEAADPNVVKVVTDSSGRALYFSRARIPYNRDASAPGPVAYYKHLGLYVYARDFLLSFPNLPRGPLEAVEKLEQLRALENGYPILVVETAHDSLGVDTEQDLERARQRAEHEEQAGIHHG